MLDSLEKMRIYLPPVDAGQLKRFAVLTMLIDHITCIFLERTYLADGRALRAILPQGKLLDSIGRAVGRQAFPIFCFLLVEGFVHTRGRPHSRLNYLARIAVFAAFSQIPFQRAFFPRSNVVHANVLVTLGLGLLSIWVLEELGNIFIHGDQPWQVIRGKSRAAFPETVSKDPDVKDADSGDPKGKNPTEEEREGEEREGKEKERERERKREREKREREVEEREEPPEEWDNPGEDLLLETDGTVCLEQPSFGPDHRMFGAFVWLFAGGGTVYGFCRLADSLHSDYRHAGILIIAAMYVFRRYRIVSLFVSCAVLSWYNKTEIYALPAFLLLAAYNGRRGKQNKYFYYIFYPAHILVLWLLRRHFFGQ